jgi:phosphoglycolate phosphatase-like HAD superfamily hydrolase
MTKIILFDVDGTVINAGGAGMRALNRAISQMGGMDNVCNFLELQGSTDRVNFENAFYSAFKRKPNKMEYARIVKLYKKNLPYEIECSVKNGKYFKIKGIEKFLKLLSNRDDVLIGLATGNLEEGAYIKLGPSELKKYFLFGGFGENYHKREDILKSAVKNAQKILKKEIKPSDVYVIGDTEKDIIAAKNLNYHSACVLDGFGDKKKIVRSGPELIEKDFSDVNIWFVWLGLKKDPKGVKRGSYICPDTPIEHAYYGMSGVGSFLNQKDMRKIFTIFKNKKDNK